MSEFFINDFQRGVWADNYQYEGETIEGTQRRLTDNIFANETEELKEQLYDALINKRLFFGGRVTANTGSKLKNVYAFNCYGAQRSTKPYDSIANIYTDLLNAAQILKTEGGIGFNFNHIRPRGTLIKGVGVGTPGVIAFMDLYNLSADLITKGNPGKHIHQSREAVTKKKIRKGAQMGMLDCRHPEIFDFIDAKKVPNRLDRFNLSVIITDEFMEALEDDGDWELWFPDIHFEKYDEEWNGDFDTWEEKGYPKVSYRTIKAKELWDYIILNTYNRNEPGIYYIDNANRFNNLLYYQKVTGTNPCGEIAMLADAGVWVDPETGVVYQHLGDICNLGSLNLPAYVDVEFYRNYESNVFRSDVQFGFDFDRFRQDVEILVRGLDNLIDISGYPLPELRTAAQLRRKIGAGIMGYGSALMMMGMRYGSDAAMSFTHLLMNVFANTAYRASARLAAERGSFKIYDEAKVLDNGFVKNSGVLSVDTIDIIRQNGLRNSQLLTCAPNGTLSIYAGCVSGGIEPVFELTFNRWSIMSHNRDKLIGHMEYPAWEKGEWHQTKDFRFEMRGDTQVLLSTCGNFMIDKSRGLTQKVECMDYGWNVVSTYPETLLDKWYKEGVFDCAQTLTAADHIEPFILLSKHIDNSLSKTVNLPNDYPIGDFDALFRRLWREGGRGLTTYREGTMIAVLETKKEAKAKETENKKEQKDFYDAWKGHENGEVVQDEISLPSEYPMQGFKIASEGRKWYLSVAFKDKKLTKPFAIFVTTNSPESNINTHASVEALVELARAEGISPSVIEENEKKIAGQNNVNKVARTISMLLRHNVNIAKIVKVMDGLDLPIFSLVHRLKKFLMRWVEEMENGMCCPACGEQVVLQEGCIKCSTCDWSKC